MKRLKSGIKAIILATGILSNLLDAKETLSHENLVYHTVRRGETLISITEAYKKKGFPIDNFLDIYRANKDKVTPSKILSGQRLLIPSSPNKVPIPDLERIAEQELRGKSLSGLLSKEDIVAFILAESYGNPYAINIGANRIVSRGLSQMSNLALDHLESNGEGKFNPHKIKDGVIACVRYLNLLYEREIDEGVYIVTPARLFAQYNAGIGTVDVWDKKLEKLGLTIEDMVKNYINGGNKWKIIPEVTIKLIIRQETYFNQISNKTFTY